MALVPHLRSIFDLPYKWAMLAESAFFLAYFVFSSPTSKLIEMIGYKKTMVVSLFIQVVGCLMFVPAARLVSFPLFLARSSWWGRASPPCRPRQIPMCPFWDPSTAPPIRLTLAQALNSLGGTIAPLVAGAYILTDPARWPPRPRLPTQCAGRTSPSPPDC
jgi:FHS family L-fucose permease-like MFS transporter